MRKKAFVMYIWLETITKSSLLTLRNHDNKSQIMGVLVSTFATVLFAFSMNTCNYVITLNNRSTVLQRRNGFIKRDKSRAR